MMVPVETFLEHATTQVDRLPRGGLTRSLTQLGV